MACALSSLVDLRDLGTGVHSTEIVELAIATGVHFGWDTRQLRELEISATLHDIGKIGIPDGVLHKDGKLDDDEAALMRRHPEYGWAILRQVPCSSGWRCTSCITTSAGMGMATQASCAARKFRWALASSRWWTRFTP